MDVANREDAKDERKDKAQPRTFTEVRRVLAKALEQLDGVDRKVGKAPPGALEREIGDYLRLMQE